MRIYTKCIDCNSNINTWTWASDRVALKMDQGDTMDLKCSKCNKMNKYHVDDFKAKESNIALIIATLVFIIGTTISFILLWEYIWQSGIYGSVILLHIISIPSIVYAIITRNDNQRVRNFNRS